MKDISRLAREATNAKRQIIRQILDLPDNPDIRRLSNDPASFEIMSSDMFKTGNWSPRYHDFISQYRLIAAVIDRTPIEKLLDKLNEIITKGVAATDGGTMRLHPGVIENLKSIMD